MKKTLKDYIFHINIIIILLIVSFCPDYTENSFQESISNFINKYLFGNIGIISDNRPFMSKVVGNYVATISIILGVISFWIDDMIITKDYDKLSPCNLVGQFLMILIGFYFTFFSNVVFKVPPKSYVNIPEDSLIMYCITLITLFGLSTYGISMTLYYLKKLLKFI